MPEHISSRIALPTLSRRSNVRRQNCLLDHLIGAGENYFENCDPEGLCGPPVHDQLEPRGTPR
jgi:hypothetical protein